MGSKTLKDLPFNGDNEKNIKRINHKLNKDSYKIYKKHQTEMGFKYIENLNFGYTDSDYKYKVPAVYVSWLWDAIFKEYGYKYKHISKGKEVPYNVNFFNQGIFTSLLITPEIPPVDFDEVREKKKSLTNIEVKFEELFTTLTQKDFIKAICNMFGLIFKKDDQENTYYFTRIDDLLGDFNNAVDYSDKLQGVNNIKFRFGSYAQVNRFKYEYDKSDDDNFIDFANGKLEVENKLLPFDKDVVKLPFKAPKDGVLQYYEFQGYEEDKKTKKQLTDNPKLKSKTTKPYIVTSNGVIEDIKWKNLIKNHYKRLAEVLRHQEVREVEMALTVQDVKDFDFFRLVYLKQYQAYYYCNNIKNYVGGKTTKVELIRVSSING